MRAAILAPPTAFTAFVVLLAGTAASYLQAARSNAAQATGPTRSIDTNTASCAAAPAWVNGARIDRVQEKIADKLGGSNFRKIGLTFYTDPSAFRKAHGYDDSVLAFTIKTENAVSIGPRVTTQNFDAVFGHELVHVILYQKYKQAIPGWLEEGLANHLSRLGKVDYAWLASQAERDVLTLAHPFAASGRAQPGGARYAYQASQALLEMIATHCDVTDLVSMSAGKKLESYLPTMCGITDLNGEFKKWVKRKSGRR